MSKEKWNLKTAKNTFCCQKNAKCWSTVVQKAPFGSFLIHCFQTFGNNLRKIAGNRLKSSVSFLNFY
jgi:hypothetical protein